MKNKLTSIIQSILICAIYISTIYVCIVLLGGKYISEANSYLELISTKSDSTQNTKLEMGANGLKLRPEYGKPYGKITIPSVNIDLNLIFGNSLEALKDGIGQNTRAYCPGEGKTIILNGHNTDSMLKRLYKVSKKDKILINTEYGSYTYEVYDIKVITEKDIVVQTNNETLVIYTNYPENSVGSTNMIYAVYANLKGE